jgi:hypothetical protein
MTKPHAPSSWHVEVGQIPMTTQGTLNEITKFIVALLSQPIEIYLSFMELELDLNPWPLDLIMHVKAPWDKQMTQ